MGFSWSLNQVKAQGIMGDFVFMAIVQAGAITLQHAGEKKKKEKGNERKKKIEIPRVALLLNLQWWLFFYFPWHCKEKVLTLAIWYAHA